MKKCLNPIIAYDNRYRVADLNNRIITREELKTNKVKLYGWTNFLSLVKRLGKQGALDELHRDDIVLMPCRKCVNCQLNRAKEWSIRNVLESKLYNDDERLFITLTYNDVNSSNKNNLVKIVKDKKIMYVSTLYYKDVQLFLKRLRKKYKDYNIRYYLAGEYGSHTLRPHYHILLYGLPLKAIEDIDYLYATKNGKFYNSQILENLWRKGFVNITEFSEYTAMYTSQYCTKKIKDYSIEDSIEEDIHNYSLNYCLANSRASPKDDYELLVKQEFNCMSRRPGIAHDYIITYKDDIYKNDSFLFHIDEKTYELKPLKYYDRVYDFENPIHYKFIKENRKKFYKAYEYFEQIESDIGLYEYFKTQEDTIKKKLSKRKGV